MDTRSRSCTSHFGSRTLGFFFTMIPGSRPVSSLHYKLGTAIENLHPTRCRLSKEESFFIPPQDDDSIEGEQRAAGEDGAPAATFASTFPTHRTPRRKRLFLFSAAKGKKREKKGNKSVLMRRPSKTRPAPPPPPSPPSPPPPPPPRNQTLLIH